MAAVNHTCSDGTIFTPHLASGPWWHDHIGDLTPVQQGESGRWYKREDWFAPYGYGSINGAKLRQLLILAERNADAPGMVTAASVKSPQIPMAALVAAHYRQECLILLGATTPESARRHETVRIAAGAGAEFGYVSVAYNPQLQRACRAAALERPGWWRLHYGITTPDDDPFTAVAGFHSPGAGQVRNLPPEVETLYIAAGSCNSITTVLAGLLRHRTDHNVTRVVAVGIGPPRLPWALRRLVDVADYTGAWPNPRDTFVVSPVLPGPGRVLPDESRPVAGRRGLDQIELIDVDLHSAGIFTYQDSVSCTVDGIVLHPTYEAKVHSWLTGSGMFPGYLDRPDRSLLWIIGSQPHLQEEPDEQG